MTAPTYQKVITYTPGGREYLNQVLNSQINNGPKPPMLLTDGIRPWSPECKAYERYPYLFQ